MYVKSFKFSRRLAVACLAALGILLIALVLLSGRGGGASTDLDTTEGRVSYLKELGWEADPASEVAQDVIIPSTFTEVLENYNQLQQEQGFDLTEYRGVRCTVYTYTLVYYPNSDCEAQACLYIYRGQVIAGDIHSTAADGFMHGLQ